MTELTDAMVANDLSDALDALESMVFQYMPGRIAAPVEFDHAFMSAGEQATQVLVRLRPNHWADTGHGLRWLGPTTNWGDHAGT